MTPTTFDEIAWWPDQVAHFIESASAAVFGAAISGGNPAIAGAMGFVQVASKEGEDFYYKWKSGEWAAGDVLDMVVHLFGVAIPVALFIWL